MTAAETEALLDGDGLTEGYGLFVGGEWVDTIDGAGVKTVNPATEEVLADVTEIGRAHV